MPPPQKQHHALRQQQQHTLSSAPPQRVSAAAAAVRVQASPISPNSNRNQSNNINHNINRPKIPVVITSAPSLRVSAAAAAAVVRVQASPISPNSNRNRNKYNIHNIYRPRIPVVITSLSPLQRIQQYEGRYHDQNTGTTIPQNNTNTGCNITRFEWEEIIPNLLKQKYHLPYENQTFSQDYQQYLANNNPLFSLCCYNKGLHPIGFKMRLWTLLGSIVFGICITNIIWLWFYYNSISNSNNNKTTTAFDDALLIINIRKDFNSNDEETESSTSTMTVTSTNSVKQLWDEYEANINHTNNDVYSISVTYGMIALWTVGALTHSMYDSIMWKLDVCYCCLQHDYIEYNGTIDDSANAAQSMHPSDITNNKWRKFSQNIVKLSIVVLIAITTFIVAVRAAVNAKQIQQEQFVSNYYQHIQQYNSAEGSSSSIQYSIMEDWLNERNSNYYASILFMINASKYSFLCSYIVEFILAVFVWYQITAYIFCSGILDCHTGTIPVIGGRLYDIKSYNRDKEKRAAKQQLQQQQQGGVGGTNALSPTNSHDNTVSSSNSYDDLECNYR